MGSSWVLQQLLVLLALPANGGGAEAPSPPDAIRSSVAFMRFNASFAGLQHYYWSQDGGAWKCCGQNGGSGGVGRFDCSCEPAEAGRCTRCYRWWGAQAVEALLRLSSTAGAPAELRATTRELARELLQRSPYVADFARAMSWVYVDDYAWYMLVFLTTYEELGDTPFLDAAKESYEFLREQGWDTGVTPGHSDGNDCGGMYWVVHPLPAAQEPQWEKNAVTNLQFLQAAARLHLLTNESRYKDHALRSWQWVTASALRDPDGLVGDGLTGKVGEQTDCCNGTHGHPDKPRCLRNGHPSYTYNQGLYVGAAALLHRITGERSYLQEAHRTLRATLSRLTSGQGVLREPLAETVPAARVQCDSQHDPAGGDFYSFKGVFALQLADFLAAAEAPQELRRQLGALVARSSDAAWRLRSEPPWAGAAARNDVCADPAFAEEIVGPPKFPYYWSYAGLTPASEAPVCMDARTQISATSLFAADYLLASNDRGTAARLPPGAAAHVFLS